jgi:hypothetical protein
MVARHDAAVLHLVSAESLAAKLTATDANDDVGGWANVISELQEALLRWVVLLGDAAFWTRIESRAAAENDPRLRTVGEKTRRSLAYALALHGLKELGRMLLASVVGLVTVVRGCGLPEGVVGKAVNEVAEKLRMELEAACGHATSEAAQHPARGVDLGILLAQRLEGVLAKLERLLPGDDAMTARAQGTAARAIVARQTAHGSHTDDWRSGLPLLERGLHMVTVVDAKAELQTAYDAATRHHARNDAFRAPGYHALPEQILKRLEEAREVAVGGDYDRAIRLLKPLLEAGCEHPMAVKKALAHLMGRRAAVELSAGLSKIPDPAEQLRLALHRLSEPLAGTVGSAPACSLCGSQTTVPLKAVEVHGLESASAEVCPSCESAFERTRERRAVAMRPLLETVYQALGEAHTIDPANNGVSDQMREVENLGRTIGLSLSTPNPAVPPSLVPTSVEKSRGNSDSKAPVNTGVPEPSQQTAGGQVAPKRRKRLEALRGIGIALQRKWRGLISHSRWAGREWELLKMAAVILLTATACVVLLILAGGDQRNRARTQPGGAQVSAKGSRSTDGKDPAAPSGVAVVAQTTKDGELGGRTKTGRSTTGQGESMAYSVSREFQAQGQLTHAAFGRKGSFVATSGKDGTDNLWNAETGAMLPVSFRHSDAVLNAVFSADGNKVVTACRDRSLRFWDLTKPEAPATAYPHGGALSYVAYNTEGTSVVTAASDGVARIFLVRKGGKDAQRLEHPAWVRVARFSPDGTLVLTGCEDGSARLWRLPEGVPVRDPIPHGGPVCGVAFSVDGERFVTASEDGTARIFNTQTGLQRGVTLRHGKTVRDVAFSPDGTKIVTASWDQTVQV